ncbi:unnamed protein product [Onchocerca ochengi]|uniref:Nuclear receptor domain-containing protein n=1 Tax=Onchocerca ochengi TaxID=42157 RepID=A0A182ELK3_ONCOC|nr:unnamed protein product [Onchocerca ochengi]
MICYSLLSFDTSNTIPALSIPQQSIPGTIPSTAIRKTPGAQLCQVCLAATSNGLHFGAKTCAACAAFFRRTVSDEKNYTCKRSQRCDIKLSYATGYRKICRSCRMKRCLYIGMLPENVQNKRQRKELKENCDNQHDKHDDPINIISDRENPSLISKNDATANNLINELESEFQS